MLSFSLTLLWLSFWTLILYLGLSISPRMKDEFSKGWLLDFWVSVFSWVAPVAALIMGSTFDAVLSLLAELSFLFLFCAIHSAYHFIRFNKKPALLRFSLSKSLGNIRVVLGFVGTLLVLPIFLIIRFGQILLYPIFIFLLRFPRYDTSEWIQVSRHKFEGLIGLDLVWCLYCEWAAGVYSLGNEMVRNHESFWCPIRFYDSEHCENCTISFPDLKKWIPQTGKMEDVQKLLEEKYPPGQKTNHWYGHPDRKST